MTDEQLEALVVLIEAIVDREIGDNNDAPPSVMLELRKEVIRARHHAQQSLVKE